VYPRIPGLPQLAAVGAIAIIAAGVAGCTSSGNSASGSSASGSSAATSPRQAIQLAADETHDVNSFAATLDIRLSGKPGSSDSSDSGISGDLGNTEMAGTFAEQLHPSLLLGADFGTFSVAGQSLAGGLGEVITPKAVYVKLSLLTQAIHTGKPWIELPLSALNQSTGLNLGSLINQAQTSSPLTQTQLLAGATDVRTAGTGTVDGVPVTEYTGTYSMSAALAKLPADLRGPIGQAVRKVGINAAQFRVWIDGQHQVRKEIVTEDASAFTETITIVVTSINQPVTISVPAASQTSTLPASVLSGATS
jgi:hypothetical protein